MSGSKTKMSRRNFLKAAGIGGLAVHTGGLVLAGKEAGSSSETYTGWESNNPGTQFFNRKPYEFTGPAHKPVGEVRRPGHITDLVFGRVAIFENAYKANPGWNLNDPLENLKLPPPPWWNFTRNSPSGLNGISVHSVKQYLQIFRIK